MIKKFLNDCSELKQSYYIMASQVIKQIRPTPVNASVETPIPIITKRPIISSASNPSTSVPSAKVLVAPKASIVSEVVNGEEADVEDVEGVEDVEDVENVEVHGVDGVEVEEDATSIDIASVTSLKKQTLIDLLSDAVLVTLGEYGVELNDIRTEIMSSVSKIINGMPRHTCNGKAKNDTQCGQSGNFLNAHGYCKFHATQDPDFTNLPAKVAKTTAPKATGSSFPCCALKAGGVACKSTIGNKEHVVSDKKIVLCSTHNRQYLLSDPQKSNFKLNDARVHEYQALVNPV